MGIRKRKKSKKFSRAQEVFNEIAETLEYVYNTERRRIPMTVIGLDAYRAWKEYDDWRKERRQFYYLRQRKLIEAKKVGDRLMVRLTEKGYRQALEAKLWGTRQKCADGVCLVTFDIPESQKVARDAFRRLLRECGFQQLHRSVWVSEYDVREPLLEFVRINKLTPWIHIFVGKIATTMS
ncbi:MAG: hypothetical protein AAB562_00440 [Patescibacteria group bacterium]